MSLRDRLSRVWGRGHDNSLKASEELSAAQIGHREPLSEADPYSPQAADNNHGSSLSPRKLHKAASTTFQAFSDSLRSRAQAFYASPSQAEVDPLNIPLPKTPKRSPRRSAIWSSIRSRGNNSAWGDKLTPEAEFEAPLREKLSSIGPAPKLNLNIPSSTLHDPDDDNDVVDDDGVTTPPETPTKLATRPLTPVPASTQGLGRRQLWPSPHMQLRNLSIAQEVSPTIQTSTVFNHQGRLSSVDEGDGVVLSQAKRSPEDIATRVFAKNSDTIKSRTRRSNRTSEDTGYVSDTESNSGTLATIASTAGTSIFGPSSSIRTMDESNGTFENAFQSTGDFAGTFWPASKVIKKSKYSSRSSTGTSYVPSAAKTTPEKANPPTAQLIAASDVRPPAMGRQDQANDSSKAAEEPEAARVSSEADDADDEANADSPQTVSMGPRAIWDEARVKRNKRYAAALQLGTTDVDASTDEDSDFGEELTTSPTLLCVRAADNEIDEHMDLSPAMRRKVPQDSKLTDTPRLVIPIEEYLHDKDLRYKLLSWSADFVLGETFNGYDASTPEGRFHVTSQLDPKDPFDAALASFCNPSHSLRPQSGSNTDITAGEDRSRFGSPQSDISTDSCAVTSRDAACFVPPPYPALHVRARPIRQVSGLIDEVRRGLDIQDDRQDLERLSDEARAAPEGPQAEKLTNDETWRSTSFFRGPLDSTLPTRALSSFMPLRKEDFPCTFKEQLARASAPIRSGSDGKPTPLKRCASTSSLNTNPSSAASRPSSYSFDVGFDDAQWFNEHRKHVDEAQGESKQLGGRRLRLADISMVERRQELQKKAA
ncbi:MAG: hypothetical protein L6R39_004543, partial [Caloplaca ligustica]